MFWSGLCDDFRSMRQYIVNAFENGPFTGNPAAVVPLESWPEDGALQAIAEQNNLSETAFFVDGDEIALRWFTPTDEIDLCGHATLATAHVLWSELGDGRDELIFGTLSGELKVRRAGDAYEMDFPEALASEDPLPGGLLEQTLRAAGVDRGEVFLAMGRVVLVLEGPSDVGTLEPDLALVAELPRGDLFVSGPGEGGYDIYTRVFAPGFGIPEDPATGAAHCAFTPYWAERLGRPEISSRQVSARGGYFRCRWRAGDGRVDLIGSCRTFGRGEIEL